MGQLSLAWVIAHPKTHPIVGARNSVQALQNIQSINVHLSDEDVAEMDAISRIVTEHLDDNPVMWKV